MFDFVVVFVVAFNVVVFDIGLTYLKKFVLLLEILLNIILG